MVLGMIWGRKQQPDRQGGGKMVENIDIFFRQPTKDEDSCCFENRGLPCGEPPIWVLSTSEGETPLCTWHHTIVHNYLQKEKMNS